MILPGLGGSGRSCKLIDSEQNGPNALLLCWLWPSRLDALEWYWRDVAILRRLGEYELTLLIERGLVDENVLTRVFAGLHADGDEPRIYPGGTLEGVIGDSSGSLVVS